MTFAQLSEVPGLKFGFPTALTVAARIRKLEDFHEMKIHLLEVYKGYRAFSVVNL